MAERSAQIKLDSSQREAVCCSGPCEIIAGPGSGKTLVLVEHILYLLRVRKIPPDQILVLTFSRAAAVQMRDRFIKRLGASNPGVTFGTFHSVFYQILRESTGTNYRLISVRQKEQILSALLEDYFPDRSSQPTAQELEKEIARHRTAQKGSGGENRCLSPLSEDSVSFGRLLGEYAHYLVENGLIDFDDMIARCRILLRSRPEILRLWQSRYTEILVDEFQDINAEQYEVLCLLTSRSSLFVVGDDDQTIYGFRGSSPFIMQNFLRDFPEARQIFMSANYRCAGSIVKAASLLIRENSLRTQKQIAAVRGSGEMVQLRRFRSQREEFAYLAAELSKLPPQKLAGCAVIFRTNAHVAALKNYLETCGISCCGGRTLKNRIVQAILEDVQAYCELSEQLQRNRIRRQTLYRVMNRPERCLLRSIAPEENVSPEDMKRAVASSPSRQHSLRELLRDLSVLSSLSAEWFLRYLFDSMGYSEWACQSLGERAVVFAALQELVQEAAGKKTDENNPSEKQLPIRDFLTQRLEKQRENPNNFGAASVRGVHILTMHGSKGLEFDRVYLPELNEGVIPGRRCKEISEIEEERRLLYVAMTRAENHLELLCLTGTADNPRKPSRFLRVFGVS